MGGTFTHLPERHLRTIPNQMNMGKPVPPIEEWVEEYVAGIATAAVRGKKPVSWAAKTLKEYDRDYLKMVLRDREGFLIFANEARYRELRESLGLEDRR